MARTDPSSSKSAARSSAARNRKAIRHKRIAAGHPKPTDWECPRCNGWFSRRRNGPENHLRFCLSRPTTSQKPSRACSSTAARIQLSSDSSSEDSCSSESDSPSDSDSSDASVISSITSTRNRRAQQVKAVDQSNPGKSISQLFLPWCK